MNEKVKVTVIFPARNEDKLIKASVLDVYNYLKRKGYEYEIIVVVNGSTDDTEEIVAGLSKKYPGVRLIKSKPGYGVALRKGFKFAKGKYIAVFNVDFYDSCLLDFVDIDLCGKDMIVGSKMTYWSDDKRPLSRRIISFLFNKYLRVIHGFKGSDTHGIKVLRSEVVKKILPKCKTDSGIFDTEFVLRAQYGGFRFADFPVEVIEKRPPRFSQRLLQTPRDIHNLYISLKKMKTTSLVTEKELFYNSIADRWEIEINKKETEKRIKVIFDELLDGIDLKNKKVLDAGCGLGFFSKKMYQRGALVTGIDIGEKLVKITRKKVPAGEFRVGNVLNIPFGDGKFDIVLCTEVIEHTKNPKKAISELFRVTKKGGLIIITTPNKMYKPLFDLLSFLKVRIYQGYEKWLSIREIKKIISTNKGLIIKEKHFNFIYPTAFLDKFENYDLFTKLMINQGYLIKK